MAFFPGQFNQAGGTWVDPSRVQTSQSGGAYIGGMAPQLPTQDMSFMWGGNGASTSPAPSSIPAAQPGWNQSTLGGWAEPPAPQMDNNHPNGVYAGAYDPNFGKPSVNLQAYQQSPYLAQMGQGLRDQFTGFMNDGLAANRGSAVAAGGVGGSRAGIAEARTMTDAGKGFDSALANLYGQDYQAQMGRNLQQYQADQNYALGNLNSDRNYNLGLGTLDSTARAQDMGFYNTNRQLDQSGALLGANLYNLGMQGPWNSLNNANGLATPYSGNGTTTTSGSSGGGAMGALGGALGTAQLWNNITKNSGGGTSWWG